MFKQTPEKRVLFVRRVTPALLALFGVFSLAFANLHAPKTAYATTSSTINFQARLQAATGAIVPDGNYNVQFKIYSASSGGSALWTESYLNANTQGLTTTNGYLTASLGSVTSFPTDIDWSQNLWLTMNIGGTVGTGTFPTIGDGEMDPRLPLTAVPYAFQAGRAAQADMLSKTGTNTSTLVFQTATGGNQTFQLQDQGATGTYNILTAPSGSDGYIKLQGASPSAQTGYFNITGTGTAATLQASTFDAASATTLNIGTSNATTVNIATNAAAHTIGIGTGAAAQSITIGSGNTTSSLSLAAGSGGISLGVSGTPVASFDSNGYLSVKPRTNGTSFVVQNSSSDPIFYVDSSDGTTHTNGTLDVQNGGNIYVANGALTLDGTATATYTSPVGSGMSTKLNIPTYDPGAFGQVIALGLGSGADSTARVITVADARTVAHQPTIAVLSPSESQIFGLSWDGSNTTALLKTTSSNLGIQVSGTNILSATTSAVAIAGILQATSFDVASAGTLAIGNTNATTINVGTNNAAHTINIGTGTGAQTVTVGSGDSTSGTIIAGGSSGIGFKINGTQVGTFDTNGNLSLKPRNNSGSPLLIQDSTGADTLLQVDATTGNTIVKSLEITNGTLTLDSSTMTTYTSPLGVSLSTKINIPNFDPGAYNQVIALGLPHGANANARVIMVADNRDTVHQPSIALLSPSESQIFGLSWDGSNSDATVKTSSSTLVLQVAGTNAVTATATNTSVNGTLQASTALYAPIVDTASAAALTVGNTNASAINFGKTGSNIVTTINGTAVIKPTSGNDSSTAFQVQNASSAAMFTVDTASRVVMVGPSGGDSTGTVFVLGTKTGSAADPTGTNGAMYYNATSNSFRCYENGVWRSCLGGLVSTSTAPSSAIANSNSLTNFSGGTNTSYGVLANDCQAGVTYTVTASGVYSTTGTPTLTLYLNEDGTSTHLAGTSAITTPSGASNLGWQLTAQMICIDTTHVEVQGSVTIGNATVSLATSAIVALIQNSGTAAWTTSSHTLYIGAQWGTADNANTITMRQLIVQRMGP